MVARQQRSAGRREAAAWLVTAAGLGLTAVRTRQRAEALPVAASGAQDAPADGLGDHVAVTARGVAVDDGTLATAAAHARRHDLDALDLVPADMPMERALDLLRTTDPATFRTGIQAPPGACQAVVLSADLVERAGIDIPDDPDRAELLILAEDAKKAALHRTDLALAPGLRAGPDDPVEAFRQMRAASGQLVAVGLLGQAAGCAVLAAGAWRAVRHQRWSGLAPLAAYSAQGLVAFAGTELQPRDLWSRSALRLPRRVVDLARTGAAAARGDHRELERFEAERPVYDELLTGGTERFFRPRRTDCPMCGGTDLEVVARMGDLRLGKPGSFALERCGSCEHIFQNPMLTEEGLAFYYRDAYDGLSERTMDVVFGLGGRRDRRRAERVQAHLSPRRWLDIGGGHGHLCLEARQVLPDTEFHVLDMSASVEQAERRGWIDRGHRGQVADHAADLQGMFDVVSMHHYLEHTIEPRSELAAAASFLAPGGILLIEVPNGHSPLARLWGGLWFNWVAPQHLHFLPQENLVAELDALGFEVVEDQGHEAHIYGVDFVASLGNLVNQLVPPVHWPWSPPRSTGARLKRAAAAAAALPLLPVAMALDLVALIHARVTGRGNAYGVVARRRSDVTAASADDAAPRDVRRPEPEPVPA